MKPDPYLAFTQFVENFSIHQLYKRNQLCPLTIGQVQFQPLLDNKVINTFTSLSSNTTTTKMPTVSKWQILYHCKSSSSGSGEIYEGKLRGPGPGPGPNKEPDYKRGKELSQEKNIDHVHKWQHQSGKILMAALTIQIINQNFKSAAVAHKKSLVNAMLVLQEFNVSRQMKESERS